MLRFLAPITDLFRSPSLRNEDYSLQVLNGQTQFNQYYKDKEKLNAALKNPALLKVIAIQCDMFSLGKVFLKNSKGEYIEKDPILNFINNPNPLQTGKQFLWDFMFWEMLGTANLYIDSANVTMPGNVAYFLEPAKIDWPATFELEKDKFVFSKARLNQLMNTQLKYYYEDGTHFQFPLSKLCISHDLSNGLGNLYKGASRIESLYKIISNSEYSLDAKNINLRYSGKFMVGAENSEGKIGLTKDEKTIINDNMDKDRKAVYPMSSLAKIQRFVEDFAKLELSKSYLDDYFLIGNMYNIPRDVLEAYQSSTYENQEKARGSHVSYTLEPKGEEFCNQFEKYFKLEEKGLSLEMDWSHLPFMQVFEKDKANTMKTKVETMKQLIELGYTKEESEKLVSLE